MYIHILLPRLYVPCNRFRPKARLRMHSSANCVLTLCACSHLFSADEQAFGCREDKLEGCLLQRKAWDINTELLTAVFTAVREPLPKEQRLRGKLGLTYEKKTADTVKKRDQMGIIAEEIDAKQAIEEAAIGEIGKASREVLSV